MEDTSGWLPLWGVLGRVLTGLVGSVPCSGEPGQCPEGVRAPPPARWVCPGGSAPQVVLLLFQIIRVLSERHPSRSYAAELERRFQDAEGVFVQSHPAEVGPSPPAAHGGASEQSGC